MFGIYVLFALLRLAQSAQSQSENSLVLLGQLRNNQLELRCITTRVEKAIVWNTQIDDDLPPDVLYTSELEISGSLHKNWITDFSLQNNFGLVLDERWEGFPTKFSHSHTNQPLAFYKLDLPPGTIRIPISVKLKAEGHVYICKNKNAEPPSNDCYWIILGGIDGRSSDIRKCRINEINVINVSPSGDCLTKRAENATNKLDQNEWKHFTVILDNKKKTISVVFEGDTTLYHIYDDDKPFDHVGVVYVNSRNGNGGLWKFHNYPVHVLRGQKKSRVISVSPKENSLCLSMYVAICDNCTIALYLKPNNTNEIINEQKYSKKKGSTWQKIKYSAMKLNNNQFYWLSLIITGESDQIVLSNIKTSKNCFHHESKYSILRVEEKDAEKVSCQYLLDDPKNNASAIKIQRPSLLPDNTCKLGAVGSMCISCDSIYQNNSKCESTIVCERDKCYCSQGFTGPRCQSRCEPDRFGFGCNESCKNCRHKPCDNGNCLIPKRLEAPKVVTPCITRCEIKFNPEINADTYVIQYKESTQSLWKNITYPNLSPLFLEGLRKTTTYTLRIYLMTREGKFYQDKTMPEVKFTTTCRNMEHKDINITATKTSAELILNSKDEFCNTYEDYNLTVSVPGYLITKRFKDMNMIEDLKPTTTYNVMISGKNYNLRTSFTTDDELPVLLEAPKVVLPCHSVCNIKFNGSNYKGTTPYVYKIEYKETHQAVWSTTGFNQFVDIEDSYYILDVFKRATSYNLRLALYTIKGKTYEGQLKETTFMTSCSEVYHDDVYISVTNTSAVLRLNVDDEREICNLENYNLLIKMQDNATVYNEKLMLNNTIMNLEPWVMYNVIIMNNNNHKLITNFTTGLPFPMEEQSNLIYACFALLLLIPIPIIYIIIRKKKIRFITKKNLTVTYTSDPADEYDTIVAPVAATS